MGGQVSPSVLKSVQLGMNSQYSSDIEEHDKLAKAQKP